MPKNNAEILKEFEALVEQRRQNADWLRDICALLARERAHYDWVGIYFLAGSELVLGPFVGAPSPHTRIPLDKGICGAAAREKRTVIVPDVRTDPRYLACSLETKAEIVVPIQTGDRVLGEIDIDSYTRDAFADADRQLLEQLAARLAEVLAPSEPA